MFQLVRVCALAAILLAQAAGTSQAPPPSPQPPQTPQTPQTPQPRPPRFRAETNLVRVDVYAMKDGAALQDLKVEDFEVYEDNTPQTINSFEHIVVHGGGA